MSARVAHPQEPHHSTEKPVIHCHKCGEPCKGEVLRVQARHFHIKCFTCKVLAGHAIARIKDTDPDVVLFQQILLQDTNTK